jgi:hypothetical protein
VHHWAYCAVAHLSYTEAARIDMSTHKQAEADRAQPMHGGMGHEGRYRALVELVLAATVVVDHDGRAILVNCQTEVFFGHACAGLLG